MEALKLNTRDEEAMIQHAIIKELKFHDWFVKPTHGSMFSSGFPDLYCSHSRYGSRWIEVKCPHRTGRSAFTSAQLETFPLMCAHGAGVWVASTHIEIEKFIVTQPCNWHMILLGGRST